MDRPHHCSLHHHHHHHHFIIIKPCSLSSPHPHHHHHHHHVLPQCNLILQNPNSKICPNLINPPPQIPQSALPLPSQTNPNLGFSGFEPPHTSQHTLYFQDAGLGEVEEIEDDEDPIFVMTDEWREFFAKSEAKRREAKKLAKKQGKT
ncbi:polycomb group protein Pc-like [Chenopodium quinoa]|uniref:polycomb group protein Pc-like n=1 Tax=Chenopodium quinoa TaxID=63459 RepID=UPI000B77BBC1|nr:polycomb group protein Pc-like [Chenopodium quinoa]